MRREPELRCYMNLMAFHSMGAASPAYGGSFEQGLEILSGAGFSGVQFDGFGTPAELAACRTARMGVAASGRVNSRVEAEGLAQRIADEGHECATIHAGWGLEDDAEACGIIDAILSAAARWNVALYIETHRATICQDMWRTVQFIRRFPEMRFNGGLLPLVRRPGNGIRRL